jgi:hypothetical protein
MRFKRKDYSKIKEKTYFAWFPVTINCETRWLEMVTVKGYYFTEFVFGNWIFLEESFVDKSDQLSFDDWLKQEGYEPIPDSSGFRDDCFEYTHEGIEDKYSEYLNQ